MSLSGRLVFFRADASKQIGTGHVTRCLSLARGLVAHGARIVFMCRTDTGDLIDLIEANGFAAVRLSVQPDNGTDVSNIQADYWQSDAVKCRDVIAAYGIIDWLIVDHYALDARWERALRPVVKNLMVIDDLADRPHDCDWFLDQTYGEDGVRYRGLLPAGCRGLFGVSYALLRPEFSAVRARLSRKSTTVNSRKVHVFFGGADAHENTLRFTALLLENFSDIALEVALGSQSSLDLQMSKLAVLYDRRLSWQKGIGNMAEHMAACGVAVGAPGMATWERACLGIPAAYLATAQNQIPILEKLEQRGLCVFIGADHLVTDDHFVSTIKDFLGDRARLTSMREQGLSAVDGLGVDKVAAAMSEASP